MDTDDELLASGQLGKYTLLRRLGVGPTAIVYLARDPFIDREVALKVALQNVTEHGGAAEAQRHQFFVEAQTAGGLRHPNITTIFDAGIDDGRCYIAMEYVAGGRTLEDHATPETLLPLAVATKLISQCALALDFAHRHGVLHRALDCQNVLVTENMQVKVSDFGVAVAARDSSATSLADSMKDGIPADLLALAVLAYRLYTGQLPFATRVTSATLPPGRPLPLTQHRAEIPEILQRILDKALIRNRSQRYKSGADLAGDLELVFDFLQEGPAWISPQDRLARISELKFFHDFPESDLWQIVHASDWRVVAEGKKILAEGEDDASFYVLVDGVVGVEKKGRQIMLLHAGDCFGEMGLLRGRRRAASIIARSSVTTLRIKGQVIDSLPQSTQNRFQRGFLLALIQRLELVTDALLSEAKPS